MPGRNTRREGTGRGLGVPLARSRLAAFYFWLLSVLFLCGLSARSAYQVRSRQAQNPGHYRTRFPYRKKKRAETVKRGPYRSKRCSDTPPEKRAVFLAF